MRNPYLLRTAAIVSLAAAALTLGWMGLPGDEAQIAPEAVAVSSGQYEPAFYFPAGFELRANPDEPEVVEYY